MPTKKLTDLFVERVKPPAHGRVEYFDASFGGLALRVTDHGHKSWSLHFRMGGRLRRHTIGNYPTIKPADARRRAQRALDRAREGIDPTRGKTCESPRLPYAKLRRARPRLPGAEETERHRKHVPRDPTYFRKEHHSELGTPFDQGRHARGIPEC